MKKIGLCLAGGGARGAYQIGVAKRLEELGILNKIQAFSGTSIGSVNAVLLSTKPTDEAFQLWCDISPDEIKKTESIFSRLQSEKIQIIENGIFSIEALRERLVTKVDFNRLKEKEVYVTLSEAGNQNESLLGLIKSSFNHFFKKVDKTVYNLLKEYDNDEIVNIILASCSIPVVFPGVVLGDKKYYDGGIYDNVPIYPLVEAGCDTVIVIHLHLFEHINKEKYPGVDILELRHKHNLGSLLKFDPNHSEALFKLGYQDAVEYFEKINLFE